LQKLYLKEKAMQQITEKQILEWKQELKSHKERLEQAKSVVEQETKLISMIEGGIQFGENLLKKNELTDPSSDKEEQVQQSETAQSN
tara:strand:+ start:269 stop:529 length:261 start_codon:yes stop_codon:yes gene_type:complete